MSVPTDPTTEIINAIWSKLEANSAFTNRVLAGNRIKFTSDDVDPYKKSTQDGDRPQVEIVPTGGTFAPSATSSTCMYSEGFDIRIITGEMRTQKSIGPLKQAVLNSIVNLNETIEQSLTYCLSVAPTAVSHVTQLGARGEDGPPGWATTISLRVEMKFLRSEMVTASSPP